MGGWTAFLHIPVPSYSIPNNYQSGSRRVQRRDCLKTVFLQKCLSLDGGQRFLATALHRRPSSLKFEYALGEAGSSS